MSRKELANAIRALSMDAVQSQFWPPAHQWAWQILPKCCGMISEAQP